MKGASGELQSGQDAAIRRTVLIVEDEVLVRMAIAGELRSAGFAVLEAASAHEALDLLRHNFDVTLVFSDIRMPGHMDGLELTRIIRSLYPVIKIVLTSAQRMALDTAEHDGYFTKPYDIMEIIRHIKGLLE